MVKISDFGMSRLQTTAEDIYSVNTTLRTIPIKWTAPEALLELKYTIATDVWAGDNSVSASSTDQNLHENPGGVQSIDQCPLSTVPC